jgi:AraC-like DNA-binding protein
VKVEAAKRALESSAKSVGSISAEIGYTDPVAFRKLFVRLTGLTPADYRRRYGLGPAAVETLRVPRRRVLRGRTDHTFSGGASMRI